MKIQLKRKLSMKKKPKKLTFVWLRNTRTCLSSLEAHPHHHQHHRSSKRKHKIKTVTLLRLRSEIKSRKLTIRNNISRNCFLLCSAVQRVESNTKALQTGDMGLPPVTAQSATNTTALQKTRLVFLLCFCLLQDIYLFFRHKQLL